MKTRRFAITDIHGCAQSFRTLVENQIQLSESDQLFLLGDYIDRGPDSKGVLDYIFELKKQGFQLYPLQGNHEEMLIQSTYDENENANWLNHGGRETLASFQASTIHQVPHIYLDFLQHLPSYILLDDYILVHAGLNFNVDDPLSDTRSMRWIRPWHSEVDLDWLGNRIILHGHTPLDKKVIEHQVKYADQNRIIDLDNGCIRIQDPGKGQLCAFNLDDRSLFFQANIDGGWGRY